MVRPERLLSTLDHMEDSISTSVGGAGVGDAVTAVVAAVVAAVAAAEVFEADDADVVAAVVPFDVTPAVLGVGDKVSEFDVVCCGSVVTAIVTPGAVSVTGIVPDVFSVVMFAPEVSTAFPGRVISAVLKIPGVFG